MLEQVSDQNKAILEALAPMPQMVRDVAVLKGDMVEVKADISVIKAVVTDISKHQKQQDGRLDNHEARMTSLEAA